MNILRRHICACLSLLASISCLIEPAKAAGLPSSSVVTGPLVSPQSAQTYYGTSTASTSTLDIQGAPIISGLPREITSLANDLGAQDLSANKITSQEYQNRVFNYVRNNIETVFTFGLSKGAYGTFVDQAGTDLDQSSLMIALLRAGGVTASYEVGTITLSATQFGVWTGLVMPAATDSIGQVQSFNVSQAAACQLLANGGIPASIDGTSLADCSYTGMMNAVTLLHSWVNVGGNRFDPSYKVHKLYAGVDIASAMGCGTATAPTCGNSIVQSAFNGAAVSTMGGVTSVSAVNYNAVQSQLSTYGNALEAYVSANGSNRHRQWLLGGKVLDNQSQLLLPQSPINYTPGVSFTNGVPDQYRIRFSLATDNINSSFWADEIAGRRLRLFGNAGNQVPFNSDSFTRTWVLYVDWIPVATSSFAGANSTNDNAVYNINYPYAANNGTYLDSTLQRALLSLTSSSSYGYTRSQYTKPITIVHQFGPANKQSLNVYSLREQNDMIAVSMRYPGATATLSPFGDYITNGTNNMQNSCAAYSTPSGVDCYRLHQPTYLQQILAQTAEMERLIGELGRGTVTTISAVGAVSDGAVNIEPTVSVVRNDGSVPLAAGMRLAANVMPAWFEGGVNEQSQAVWEGMSGLSMLVRSMQNNNPMLDVNAANISNAIGQLQNYNDQDKANMATFAGAGFSLIAPKNMYLGTFTSNILGTTYSLTPQFNGSAVFSVDYSKAAFLERFLLKGGSAPESDWDNQISKMTKPDTNVGKARDFGTISAQDGSLSLELPPDLSVGFGSQGTLSLTRMFRSQGGALLVREVSPAYAKVPRSAYEIAETGTVLGPGWSLSPSARLRIDSDGFRGMGYESALDASGIVPGLYSLINIGNAPSSFNQRIAAILAAYYSGEQLVLNSINVQIPPSNLSFVKLPSGRFSLPGAKNWALTQSGTTYGPFIMPGSGGGFGQYIFNANTFNLTSPDGDIYTFIIGGYNAANFAGQYSGFGFRDFVVSKINRHAGDSLNFSYFNFNNFSTVMPGVTSDYEVYSCLNGISTSFGRNISLTITGGQHHCLLTGASDDAGNSVTYIPMTTPKSPIANTLLSNNGITFTARDGVTVDAFQQIGVNDAAGNDGTYSRSALDLTAWNRNNSPQLSWSYDGVGHAAIETDANSHSWSHRLGAGGGEQWHEAHVLSPLTEDATSRFFKGGQLQSIDPLQRSTAMTLNDINQVVRSDLPGGGALERTYDVRGNVLTECRVSSLNGQNPCNPANGDLRTVNVYMEDAAVWPCVNPKICNKLSYSIDPRGSRTDYAWCQPNNTDCPYDIGELFSKTLPADASGNRPQTKFGYSAFVGTDGSTFYMMTQKIEKRSPSQSTVTSYEYDSSNHWVLKSETADVGGLALRTCFKFDATGNLISKTEPRAGLLSCP